jgi:putative addiction module component (TIGR02574 family)
MPQSPDKFDFSGLSAQERLDLIGALCDSLSPEEIPVTEEQKQELDRRMKAFEAGEMKSSSWEAVKHRLKLPK